MPSEGIATRQGSWVRVDPAKVASLEQAQRRIDELQLRLAEVEARNEELVSHKVLGKNILGQPPDVVFVKDVQGRHFVFNPAAWRGGVCARKKSKSGARSGERVMQKRRRLRQFTNPALQMLSALDVTRCDRVPLIHGLA